MDDPSLFRSELTTELPLKCHVEMPSLYHLSPVTPLKMNALNLEIPKSPNISQLKKEHHLNQTSIFRFKIGKILEICVMNYVAPWLSSILPVLHSPGAWLSSEADQLHSTALRFLVPGQKHLGDVERPPGGSLTCRSHLFFGASFFFLC